MKQLLSNIPEYMVRGSAVIIALMPFHAFLTVWLSSAVGHYTLLRLWKEVLLLLLFLGAMAVLVLQPHARKTVRRQPLIAMMALYMVLIIVVGGVSYLSGSVSLKAYAYGVLLDSRYLVFFFVVWLATHYNDLLVRLWKQLLLIPAAAVSLLAVLQYALLPADFLRHFGYGDTTIRPMLTIDQKDAYRRVQSTLRGPNTLGAYLVVVLTALGSLVVRAKRQRLVLAGCYVLAVLALVFSFSRSAWLGTLAAAALVIWRALRSARLRRVLLVSGAAAIVAFGAVMYVLRDNDKFQNVFFHTSEQSKSQVSSNAGHASATKGGVRDILTAPLGSGAGTAGPASVYNSAPGSTPRIAENYFIQIGQESGVVGLALFIVINGLVAKLLWNRRANTLAAVLLMSFVGITIINLLMHAWADDTLAYIWWGLAGAAIALPPVQTDARHAV